MIKYLTAILILFQRTEIQTHSDFLNKTPQKLRFLIVGLQAFNYKKVFKRYEQSISSESSLLADIVANDFSKSEFVNILDVGCGIAGYHKSYLKLKTCPKVVLYLMDSSDFNFKALRYGHGESDRYYNSLSIAKSFLTQNSDSKNDIIKIEIKKDFPEQLPKNIDIIVSFISWGFHYSLELYWNILFDKMNSNSIMILDVRKESESSFFLSKQSNILSETISSNGKFNRIKIRRIET
jgi:hypothetical protein